MNITERITNILIDELNYDEEKKEIISYGIESFLLAIIGSLLLIVAAWLLQVLYPALIAAVFGGLLRKVSGGAHLNSPIKCIFFSAVVYSLLGLLTVEIIDHGLYDNTTYVLGMLVSMVVVALLAPVDSKAKPIYSPTFRKKLKLSSITIVIVTIMVIIFSSNPQLNTSAALGIGYQTVTLLPIFNKRKEG